MVSLHPTERWCFGSHVGLDHYVDHLRLHCYFARRNRLFVSCVRWCLLLVVHAFASEIRPFGFVDRRLVVRYRKCGSYLVGQFCYHSIDPFFR
jgi:hypothetical protein